MCGFIGIIGPENVAFELFNGLLQIQHRGQDGCGILTFDGDALHMKKGPGLVSECFNSVNLHELKGNIGIGHVRYPTIGSDVRRDAQPIQTGYPYGIGMAHNGNTVNYDELRKHLMGECHRQIRTNCDAELILKLFATELSKANGNGLNPEIIFDAISKTMERLNGSYSVVTLIAREGLLAFRDPHGIRPIIWGKRVVDGKDQHIFASETVVLDVLGYKVVKDLEPGEAVFISKDGVVTTKSIKKEQRRHCMFEWVYFARPDSVIEKHGVYEARLELGRMLAKEWMKKKIEVDVVIPAPDTSRTAALTFATEIGVPYREGLIKNRYVGRTFLMPTQKNRESAVRTKLNPVIKEISGKRVALVDDSIVRGTTSKRIIQMLREVGAKEVHFLSSCPPLTEPCYYGVDFPTKDELIASGLSVDEIAKKIGADSLTYQTIDGLVESTGMPKENLCLACLNGEYPTDIKKYADLLDKCRKCERGEDN
ncbi:MAG: amidophosphoribosyltransferase [archaeon]